MVDVRESLTPEYLAAVYAQRGLSDRDSAEQEEIQLHLLAVRFHPAEQRLERIDPRLAEPGDITYPEGEWTP